MKRSELEKYLGKYVKVKLYAGDVLCGWLQKTGSEKFSNDPNLFIPKKYYFVTLDEVFTDNTSYLFKTSHVLKLKEDNHG